MGLKKMDNVLIKALNHIALDEQPMEICERKGLGHPDTICDSIMNQASIELSKEYLKRFGKVLHHNLDKGLISAGGSKPAFGGGEMTSPILIVYGDRATYDVNNEYVPVDEITIRSTQNWFKKYLRFVNPDEHLKHQVVIKPGSSSLQDIFARKGKYLGANDTSAAVGYAPYSRMEKTILDLENYLNSKDFKKRYPESGEDIKIMGFRNDNKLNLTIAMAFVDRFIESEVEYFRKKSEIYDNISDFLKKNNNYDKINVGLNVLDVKGRGLNGLHLTVLGTSADTGDSGQVGRGNNVIGLIPLNRPMSAEAASGKNPTSHVGKIYNLLSYKLANEVYCCTEGIKETYFWLVSAIGQPINKPVVCNVQLILEDGIQIEEVASEIENVIAHEFEHLDEFCMNLAIGKIKMG